LVKALYSPTSDAADMTGIFRLERHAIDIPFYFIGHSMGAATAVYLGHILSRPLNYNEEVSCTSIIYPSDFIPPEVKSNFSGCLLLCPAIDIKTPSPMIVALLDNLIVPFFGVYGIPEFIQATSSNEHLIWKDPSFINYVKKDGFPANPDGLSYGQPIRFQTASSLLRLAGKCRAVLSSITYPFIVFHDPLDQVALMEGSNQLYDLSQTPVNRKSIIEIDGGLHDLMSNELTLVTDKMLEWVRKEFDLKKISSMVVKEEEG
jgi:pimeloyl-ACP methyl ester carboxylesterase